MDPQTIWYTETKVKTYETDFKGKWRPASFIQAMIEAASEHAAALGFWFAHPAGGGCSLL